MPSKANQERINRLKIESILLVVIIISLIAAISINATLIRYLKEDHIPTAEQEEEIRNKAKAIAWVYIVASIYFAYSAYKDYEENQDNARFFYFVAAALLVAASFIRIYFVYKSNDPIEGSEDFSL